ncbi:hypothetical protein BE221DRAFT_70340, partial [Ostreococcus tauri]
RSRRSPPARARCARSAPPTRSPPRASAARVARASTVARRPRDRPPASFASSREHARARTRETSSCARAVRRPRLGCCARVRRTLPIFYVPDPPYGGSIRRRRRRARATPTRV